MPMLPLPTMVDTTATHTDMVFTTEDTMVDTMAILTLMVILMDTDTELSLLTMPPALATNTFPPLLPLMVSLNSTKDPLMPNLRLMLMPLSTMVDTMAIPDTDTTVTDTDMVVIMADTDMVVSATTVKL